MRKIKIICLAVLTVVLCAGVCFAATPRIGVINQGLIIVNSPKYRAVQTKINDFKAEANAELGRLLANEQNQDRRDQYRVSTREIIEKKEQELLAPILKDIEEAVAKIARARRLVAVHNTGSVYYGAVDITQLVIDELNKK